MEESRRLRLRGQLCFLKWDHLEKQLVFPFISLFRPPFFFHTPTHPALARIVHHLIYISLPLSQPLLTMATSQHSLFICSTHSWSHLRTWYELSHKNIRIQAVHNGSQRWSQFSNWKIITYLLTYSTFFSCSGWFVYVNVLKIHNITLFLLVSFPH